MSESMPNPERITPHEREISPLEREDAANILKLIESVRARTDAKAAELRRIYESEASPLGRPYHLDEAVEADGLVILPIARLAAIRELLREETDQRTIDALTNELERALAVLEIARRDSYEAALRNTAIPGNDRDEIPLRT